MRKFICILSCIIVFLCASVPINADDDQELTAYTYKGISFDIPEKWETLTISDTFIAQPDSDRPTHISIGIVEDVPMDLDREYLESVFLPLSAESLLSGLIGKDESDTSKRYEFKDGTIIYTAVDIKEDNNNAVFVMARSVGDNIVTVTLTENAGPDDDTYTEIALKTILSMRPE